MLLHTSLAAPPLHKEEGSGTAPLLELFFSPEILGNMNCKFWGRSMTAIRKREPQPCSPRQSALRAAHMQWLTCHRKA